MSKQSTGKLLEDFEKAEQQSGLGQSLRDGVSQALSPTRIFGEIGAELRQLADHGRTELAAALFNGSPFVMYMKGQETNEQSQAQSLYGSEAKEQQHERGGPEM